MVERYRLTVNGTAHEFAVGADTPLLGVLRNELGLTGAKFGCGVGLCGACFVLLDGRPVASCETPMSSVDGRTAVTPEGLGGPDAPHPLHRAFLAAQAAQCGYCLSGILVSAAALLAENPAPDEAAVVTALDRNLCRCGAQTRMVRAVLRAAELMRGDGPPPGPGGNGTPDGPEEPR